MQKLLTKYGLAAHLALLAVAPLFLSATTILWLSGLALVWVLIEPSRIGGEMLHDARQRVAYAVFTDPLFWVSLLIAVVAGVRCWNDGVALSYDAEAARWLLSEPVFPMLPSSVRGAGLMEFAVACALVAVLQGCRHAMGRSARCAFALVASFLSGIGAICLGILYAMGNPWCAGRVECALTTPMFIGSAFGVYLAAGIVAMLSAFENKWFRAFPLTLVAVCGNALGLVMFSPPVTAVLFAAIAVLVFAYAFVYAFRKLGAGGEFKVLVVFSISLVAAGLLLNVLIPREVFQSKIAVYSGGDIIPEGAEALRNALSAMCVKIWKGSPWLGSGLGAFPLSLKFVATDADWVAISPFQAAPLNGYWLLLVERGVVGAFVIACPLALLLWTYGLRLVKGILKELPHPLCWVGPFMLVAATVETLVDASFLFPGATLSVAAFMAVSASAFPKEKHNG